LGEGRGRNEKEMMRGMRGEIDPEISRWIYKGKKETKMKNETMLESEGERVADRERKMYVHVKEKVC
jgi:hypothetical protein